MALINKETNNYIRIDYKNSYISSTGVHCLAYVYKDKNERLKEIERSEKIQAFLYNLNSKLEEIAIRSEQEYFNFIKSYKDAHPDEENIDEKSIEYSPSENYILEISVLSDILEAAKPISKKRYIYTDTNMYVTDEFISLFTKVDVVSAYPLLFDDGSYKEFMNILEPCGFEEEWILDPVQLISVDEVYCSNEYIDKVVSYEQFYHDLKENYSTNYESQLYVDGENTSYIFEDDI